MKRLARSPSILGGSVKMRKPTMLVGLGDEMCELNIQRRLQWLRELNPRGFITVSEEMVKADPAMKSLASGSEGAAALSPQLARTPLSNGSAAAAIAREAGV
jgi:hypothetical protein